MHGLSFAVVTKRFSDTGLRHLLFEAIRDSTLSLELRPRTGDAPGRFGSLAISSTPIGASHG
jgi:hypothetical protein